MGLSSLYADFIDKTSYDKLPPEVTEQAKQRLLDLVGVSLAGYKLMEFPRLVVNYMAGLGGIPEATIIQTRRKFPAINAALANASCAHALDMDDGHRYAALHPGAAVIPAALAATEMSGATTKELISGIVVGYEVMIRIGMAINPSSLQRGFHTTGIAGSFGATAAVANIMKLSKDEVIGALGLAGLQASGLLQVNHDDEGAKVKPINPAKAAMSGVFSSILAQQGARGPIGIFEGEDGFLNAVADEVKDELLTRNLGERFEINNVYNKFYAACRHAHPPIDAALQLLRMSQVSPEEISRIYIETYPTAIRLAGRTNPSVPSSGRFSIPFSVALALIKRDAGADKYTDENIADRNIRRLAEKVQLAVSDKWEKLCPNKRGATVTITDTHGRIWSTEVELARGEPECPASEDDMYKKFYTNATLLISEKEAKSLYDAIMNLEDVSLTKVTSAI